MYDINAPRHVSSFTTIELYDNALRFARYESMIRRIHYGRRPASQVFQDMAWARGYVQGKLSMVWPRTPEESLRLRQVQNEISFLLEDYLIEGL